MSPTVIWFCVALACFAAEIFTPNFVLMFFGIGALAASGFSFFVGDTVTEFLIFSIISIASMFFLRSKVLTALLGRSTISSLRNDTGQQGQPGQSGQTGRTGTVTKTIPVGGEGEIAMGGSFWRAVADESIPEGTSIRVTGHVPGNEILMHVIRQQTA